MAQIKIKNDPVFHPNHYNWIPGIECVDVVEHFEFNIGSAIKYLWRAPTKQPREAIVDLRKAIFLIQRQIDSMTAFMEAPEYGEVSQGVDLPYFEPEVSEE